MRAKRWLGLVLALALCLPTVSASAAGSIQSAAYGAYYELIQKQIAEYGVINDSAAHFENYWTYPVGEKPQGLIYAQLIDFDKNGVDELLLLRVGLVAMEGYIYTYSGGQVVLLEEFYPTDGSGLDYPYNFQLTMTTDASGKTYFFEFHNGRLVDEFYYYSIVNGKWGVAKVLDRHFEPDIRIGDIYSDTGTYTYYNGDILANAPQVTQAQFQAIRDSMEVTSVTYANTAFPDLGHQVLPSGTVPSVLNTLKAYGDPETVMYYTPPAAWAAQQVNAAIADGIVPAGMQNSYPKAITRAEFCALAANFYEKYTGTTVPQNIHFTDTQDASVEKMATLGVVSGVGNGAFAPNQSLTREQAAVILGNLAKALGNPFPSAAPSFSDNASIAGWAVNQVGQVQAAGIMGGVGNNQFSPQGAYTREQSIVTIMRMEWVVVPVSGITLDQKEVTLRAGQTQALTASLSPANATNQTVTWSSSNSKVATVDDQGLVTALSEGEAVISAAAANGVRASCTFHVEHENTIAFTADLPVTLDCLAFPPREVPDDDAGIDYMPSDPIVAGSLTVTDMEWSNKYVTYDQQDNTRAVTLTCRLESKVAGLEDQFYPYVKWQVKDSDGKVIDSGLERDYSDGEYRAVGDTFTLTFSLANTVPGEAYTLSFVEDSGKDFDQVSHDEPTVQITGLPVTVTETRGYDTSTVTVTGAQVQDMEYNTRYNEFRCGIAFWGTGSVNYATNTPEFFWTMTDSSGAQVASGSWKVFSSDLEDDGTFYFEPKYSAKSIDLEPGESYTVYIYAEE